MTAWLSPIVEIASARFAGSFSSNGGGVLIEPTAQNLHPLVHSWPATMKVASLAAQHSWMFGHRASWQTVCSMLSVTVAFVSLNLRCSSPVGKLVLNHSGRRGLVSAMLSFRTVTTSPPIHPEGMGWKKNRYESLRGFKSELV